MRKIQGIRNKNGYTELCIWLGPKRNPDGSLNKPHYKTFGPYTTQNILRARTYMETARKEFGAGNLPKATAKPVLFSYVCDLFFHRHFEMRQRSHKAKRNVKSKLNIFKAYWSNKLLHTFKPSDIEAYRMDREKAGIGLGTINNDHSILSSVFARIDEYVKRGEIDPVLLPEFNPCEYVSQPNTDHLKRERVASRDELKAICAWGLANDSELLEYIKRAIVSGLRKEDLKKMQGQAKIRTLTGKTKRLVALPLDWSEPVHVPNYQKRWEALRKAVKMTDFHWHDLRHTGATMLKELGVAEEIIQEILAHSNIKQTRDYINRKEERVGPALEKLKAELDAIMPSNLLNQAAG